MLSDWRLPTPGALRETVRLAPDHAIARVRLVAVLARAGRCADARTALGKASRLSPSARKQAEADLARCGK